MRLSYHHANPGGGNESLLLRYQRDETTDGSVCVLIDAGAETQPERILQPADELAGICLTHAHLDHYQSLESCRQEETTIYTSEPTAAILDDVFNIAARDYDVTTNEATTQAIQPINGWTDIAPGLAVHPVPVGHVPGAVGYLFQLDDNGRTIHVLATGDFTRRRAGGYPGFDPSSYLDIDVLLLTVATDRTFRRNLSEALATALQRAHSGAETLVATSGLLGTQVTYLLNALAIEFDRPVPIRAAGQVAKIYETLGYTGEYVETIPKFSDPQACLAPGAITIAGPEVPHERSSGRLFGVLRSDPGACVIQLLGSGAAPIDEGQCTIHSYDIVNHPTRETIDEVHDTIDPHTTIVTHRHRGAGAEFNDLDSVVWSPTDAAEYTLYEDGEWVAPPWMGHGPSPDSRSQSGASTLGSQVGDDIIDALSIPSLDRHETVDFETEGIDLERVEKVLSQRMAYAGATSEINTDDRMTAENGQTPAADPEEEPAAPDGDGRDSDSSNETSPEPSGEPATLPSGLADTATMRVDGIDPQIVEAVDNGDIEAEDVAQAFRIAGQQDNPARQESQAHSNDDSTGRPEGDSPTSEAANESAAGHQESSAASASDEVRDSGQGVLPGDKEGSTSDESEDPTATESDSEETETAPADTSVPDTGDTNSVQNDDDPSSAGVPDESDATSIDPEAVELTLSPLTAALTGATVEISDLETREQVIVAAVREYIEQLLRSSEVSADSSPNEIVIQGDGNLHGALEIVTDQTGNYGNVSELLESAIAGTIGSGSEMTLAVSELGPFLPLIDAVVEGDRQQVSSREAVVAIAVQRHLASL